MQVFGLCWVVPGSCYGLLSGQAGFIKRKGKKIMWNYILFAILWAIWGERNRRIFEGSVSSENELWKKICFWVAIWLKNVKSFRFLSFSDLTRALMRGFKWDFEIIVMIYGTIRSHMFVTFFINIMKFHFL